MARTRKNRRPTLIRVLIGLALLAVVILLAHALNLSREEYIERLKHKRKASEAVSPRMRRPRAPEAPTRP